MEQGVNSTDKRRLRFSGHQSSTITGRQASCEFILLCTTVMISPQRKERIRQLLAGTVDWEYLLQLARFHDITSLLYHNLSTNSLTDEIPPQCLKRISHIYHNTLYKNLVIANELTTVLASFRKQDIDAIALKGTILTEQLYGNLALRTMEDMDVLVKPEQLASAESLLKQLGYQRILDEYILRHPFHKVYYRQAKMTLIFELHWNLDDERLISVPRDEIWQRARHVETQNGSSLVLSTEDTLLFLCNHFSKQSSHILKSLCDINELLKKHEATLDWDYIVRSADEWGIRNCVYHSLKWNRTLLGAEVPASLFQALKPDIWRRCLLAVLIDRENLTSVTNPGKLRAETFIIVRSLMMERFKQLVHVLAYYRGGDRKVAWLKSTLWILLITGATLVRKTLLTLLWWRRPCRG